MNLLEISLSFVFGCTLSYLFFRSRKGLTQSLQDKTLRSLEEENRELKALIEEHSFKANRLEKQLIQKEESLNGELKLREQKLRFVEEKLALAELQFQNQLKGQEEMIKKSSAHFENLANKIFEEKSTRFADQNMTNLNLLLSPLKEKLKDFEKKVEDAYSSERSERGVLRGEISKLIELNHVMSREAENLTKALKGENKTQGNWGELILENILERSGLRKNEEYIIQGTDMDLRGSDGGILKPDVVVRLPENKHLVVDAKMTLNAYEAYSSATTEEEKALQSKLFLDSLKRHIEGLSGKQYHLADNLISPDFVMLFMPLEPAFALAFQLHPEIFQEAWDKNIAIVSPTTLLTSLRTAATLWKQDRQQKNALSIAKRGGALYDKFVGFVKDLEELGAQLEETQRSYHTMMGKLHKGKGNLISQVETLKKLGAKAEKALPQNLVEEATDNTDSEEKSEDVMIEGSGLR